MSAEEFLKSIRDSASKISRKIRLMEVCGTHTVSIFRAGIRQLLPKNIELVSGPGCPVCVTSDDFLDKAIEYSKNPNIIIATFGDMLRVPGSKSTLRESTGDIRAIYSPLDSIRIAQENPSKTVIFLAVGFETTAPTAAATILEANRLKLENLKFLSVIRSRGANRWIAAPWTCCSCHRSQGIRIFTDSERCCRIQAG